MKAGRVLRFVVVLLGLCAASGIGCATTPKPPLINDSGSFTAPYDDVWSSVIEAFAELNLPIDKMEKDSGKIATDWISLSGAGNEDYCDCGALGPNVERSREGRLKVVVKEDEGGGGVRVDADTLFRQVRVFGNAVSTKNCVSTGVLEAKIRGEVEARL